MGKRKRVPAAKRKSGLSLTPEAKEGLKTVFLILLIIVFFPFVVLWELMKRQK